MEFTSQIIPAIAILFANLLGGDHGSQRYEICTAIFGWTSFLSFLVFFFSKWAWPEASSYLLQLFGFSILTALSRDYEKILKPYFDRKNKTQ